MANWWNRALLTWQKICWISNCLYCTDRTQICQGQPPTMYSQALHISSKSVHFGGVIAKTCRKVNPVFAWSISSNNAFNVTLKLIYWSYLAMHIVLTIVMICTLTADCGPRLPSNKQHQSCDDCLEVKRENNQNCSVLCCVQQLITVLKFTHWSRFKFYFCVFL